MLSSEELENLCFEDQSAWDQSTLDPPPYKGAMRDIAKGVHEGDLLFDSLSTPQLINSIHTNGEGLPSTGQPSWDVNWQQISNGQHVWRELLGPTSVSLSGALLLGFSIHRFAEVLVLSGYADSADSNFRRYQATAYHTQDWMRFDLQSEDSPARKSIKQVRAMHSLARRKAIEQNLMQKESNGIPLSQYDMAETLFAFSSVSIDIICHTFKLSHKLDDTKRRDMISVWRLIGFYLGIQDEYNTCSSLEYNKKCFFDWHTWSVCRITSGSAASKKLVETTCEGFGKHLPAGLEYWKAFYKSLFLEYNAIYKCDMKIPISDGLSGVSQFIRTLLPVLGMGPVSRRIQKRLYIERDAYFDDRPLFNRIQTRKQRASQFSDNILWPCVSAMYSVYKFIFSRVFLGPSMFLILYHIYSDKVVVAA